MNNVFKVVAFLEGVSYILLLFIAVPVKYWGGNEHWVKLLGMPHGILFMAYIVLAYLLKDKRHWNKTEFFIVLVASVIPFCTFYLDKKFLRS